MEDWTDIIGEELENIEEPLPADDWSVLQQKYAAAQRKKRATAFAWAWEYLREEEFKGAIKESGGLCVMVLGCLEKHGQHLPVGCDSIKGDGIVKEAAKLEDVVIVKFANKGHKGN